MFERFSERARRAMAIANQEALRFQHESIGTEHLLLGLMEEGSGVGVNVLKNLDVDLRKVRLEVERLLASGSSDVTTGKVPPASRTKRVIEYAILEAKGLNHNWVGTEHLLLGLLREQGGVAAQVLTDFGLKLDQVRDEVVNLLGVSETTSERIEKPPNWYAVRAELFKDHPLVQHFQPLMDLLQERKDRYVAEAGYEKAAELRDVQVDVATALRRLYELLEKDPDFGR